MIYFMVRNYLIRRMEHDNTNNSIPFTYQTNVTGGDEEDRLMFVYTVSPSKSSILNSRLQYSTFAFWYFIISENSGNFGLSDLLCHDPRFELFRYCINWDLYIIRIWLDKFHDWFWNIKWEIHNEEEVLLWTNFPRESSENDALIKADSQPSKTKFDDFRYCFGGPNKQSLCGEGKWIFDCILQSSIHSFDLSYSDQGWLRDLTSYIFD